MSEPFYFTTLDSCHYIAYFETPDIFTITWTGLDYLVYLHISSMVIITLVNNVVI